VIAEKMAKKLQGYFILHPVDVDCVFRICVHEDMFQMKHISIEYASSVCLWLILI